MIGHKLGRTFQVSMCRFCLFFFLNILLLTLVSPSSHRIVTRSLFFLRDAQKERVWYSNTRFIINSIIILILIIIFIFISIIIFTFISSKRGTEGESVVFKHTDFFVIGKFDSGYHPVLNIRCRLFQNYLMTFLKYKMNYKEFISSHSDI